MIAVDTNLWARAILGDDPRQSPAARQAIAEAAAGPGIFVPVLVFVELAWILKSAPDWGSVRIQQALERLLNMEGVEVEAAVTVRAALDLSTGSVGLVDNLVSQLARERGCTKLLTLDARFAKTGRAILLKT